LRVVVGMSGGVDSSTTALLLKEKGYDVIGITLILSSHLDTDCFSQDVKDAKRVADYLGIEHIVVDFQEVFKERVIDYFVNEYREGLTPNPCSICNRDIKMGLMLDYAINILKADKLATGHYARIDRTDSYVYFIRRGKDLKKDQSYFLALINKENLKYLLFPLGEYTKEEVREIALKNKLPVAKKKESFEICFTRGLTPSEYMLKNNLVMVSEGDIVHISGKKIGKHRGLFNYTIGQRRGLGIRWREPLYVITKDIKANNLIVGERKYLTMDKVSAKELNQLIPIEKWEKENICIQGRYKQKCIPIKDFKIDNGEITITFNQPQEKFAPGQILALYQRDILLGGGIISN